MKLNKKGFMMAEVIIVSVLILTILISMYTGYNKVIRSYDQRIDYYNVDGVYLLAYIRDSLISYSSPGLVEGNYLNYFLRRYKNYSIDHSQGPLSDSYNTLTGEISNVIGGGIDECISDVDDPNGICFSNSAEVFIFKKSDLYINESGSIGDNIVLYPEPTLVDYILYLKDSVVLTNDNSYIFVLSWKRNMTNVQNASFNVDNYYYSYLEVEV